VGFNIGNKGYVGTGDFGGYYKDFWEYTPEGVISQCYIPTSLLSNDIAATTANLNWDASNDAIGYQISYKSVTDSKETFVHTAVNSKVINGLNPSAKYFWQVRSVCGTNQFSFWSVKETFITNPLKLRTEDESLFDILPNPFSNSTIISFTLYEDASSTIELFDLAGRKLQTILNGNLSAGNHEVTLNRGQLTSGIYFLEVRINANVEVIKLIIE
jgi:hypothetical protein